MKPILEIKNIRKKFDIVHNRQPYLSLRDSMAALFKQSGSTAEEFYALDDISFNVNEGESIGIIGKNGAGKSTLLKILSKITPPTSGSIISRGRVASLLEVGTGFHPELTGRENIFLNGSILGMKQKEVKSKFDEIVDFSGTEKFLDTPLKHFSSGMQLRLAFSVAAFLEPEILVIDEVLAVGDAEFQKKCLGKMEEVGKSGKTVLFVSHNMGAVLRLCSRAVLINEGKIVADSDVQNVISQYYTLNESVMDQVLLSERKDRKGNGKCKFQKVWFTNKEGKVVNGFQSGDYVEINALVKAEDPNFERDLYVSVSFCNALNERMFSLGSGLLNKKVHINGLTEVKWIIDKLQLAPGEYMGDLFLFETIGGYDMYDMMEQVFRFVVDEGDFHHSGQLQSKGRDMFFVEFDVTSRQIPLNK
ncbi:MAG TPA: ABC transporter ATP-binding protein [Bacteroidia bacterium]|nr:ABC transporter ATP-binding protein [Bacteroidia bacterium]